MQTQQRNFLVIGIIVAMAAVAAVIVIIISSNNTSGSSFDYSSIHTERLADGGFILGDPNAPITIVEFADFLCPHCQEYEPTIERLIQTFVSVGQARLEYRTFPVIDATLSPYVAGLAECSDDQRQGAFWSARDTLFAYASAGRVYNDTSNLTRNFANDMGLDYGGLLQCLSSANQAAVDQELGRGLGVSGTPAVMVRYGNSAPTWITYNGQTYNRGGVAFDVIAAVIIEAQVAQ
ncbi:MAG: thioredoxin domain-containing protein [Anaerolineae bacterium]